MRCLTLAEELRARGHEAVFVGTVDSVSWLDDYFGSTGFPLHPATPDGLDAERVLALDPDWVVIDSYRIDAASISALTVRTKVLALVDGDARGINATLYLDQNLGADEISWSLPGRMLAGSRYALIRDDILRHRPAEPAILAKPMRLTAFMGGTDPSGMIVTVARQLATVAGLDLTIVAPSASHPHVRAALAGYPLTTILDPTNELPALLGAAQVIVSAAGTSAWDICTLGVPALFVGVVDNQSASLAALVERGLALGIDLAAGQSIGMLAPSVRELVENVALRRQLSARCAAEFDGLGKARVVDVMLENRLG